MTGPADCAGVEARAADLVRDPALAPDLAAHVAGCAACAKVVQGARRVGADLAAWTAPPPPADLVERALARAVVSALAQAPAEPAGRVIPMPAPRRRTSVELLTTTPFEGAPIGAPPTRRRLLLRLVTQAAAAAVLFAMSTTFVAVFYPAVAHAIEQKHIEHCQERLARLSDAARRYRREHEDGPALSGPALRRALIDGGYVAARDLECPGPRGRELGINSYWGDLPAHAPGGPAADRAIFWDRFGNHAEGFNVVHADGRCETVGVESLHSWMQTRAGAAEGEQGE